MLIEKRMRPTTLWYRFIATTKKDFFESMEFFGSLWNRERCLDGLSRSLLSSLRPISMEWMKTVV
jgi:hypothetical protein